MDDVLGDEQDLQAVLGHADFGGFDNDALDFRNLEDYINGDDENTMYFTESLVGDVKAGDPSVSVLNPNGPPGGLVGPKQPTILHQHPTANLLYPVTNNTTCYKNNLINSGYTAHMHNLPESPPDSGSEPPYSPPDEDQKLQSVHLSMRKQPTAGVAPAAPPLLSYSNTQPLKHMEAPLPSHLPPLIQHHQLHHPHSLPHSQHLHNGPVQAVNPMIGQHQQQQQQQQQQQPTTLDSTTNSLFNNLVRAPPYPTNKKRKHSESPNAGGSAAANELMNGIVHIKQEPGNQNGSGIILTPPSIESSQRPHCSSPDHGSNHSTTGPQLMDDDISFDFNGDPQMAFVDSNYQCIRFQPFQQSVWHVVCDANLKELPLPNYRVDADKGFNFSNADDAFVCQKKNHFQVTVHAQLSGEPHYVKTPEGLKKIDNFYVHFYGVKVESPSQSIKIEQSQSDRSKKPFHPVQVELANEQMVKITVGRLHFSETTSNNMRKKGKPNPDQRYFYLVIGLHAHCGDTNYPLVSSASERIIVRASNPGQFESEVELSWQKGLTAESVYHSGRVGINTERPDESLVVHGNVKVTGHIAQPSDVRAKEDIQELDTKEQLRNLQQLRIVRYQYREEFAKHAGLQKDERHDTGVIAQEVQKVLPDAVKESGDIVLPSGQRIDNFLVVNKDRIFMENIGAVKELCKVTDNLENRIDELERMNNKLAKLRRIDSLKSTSSGTSTITSVPSSASTSAKKPLRRGTRRTSAKEGLCSNKFVQGTIIVLILVMAMCLIAMATLYILEWQKRQIYDIPNGTTLAPNHSTPMSYNGSSTTTNNNNNTTSGGFQGNQSLGVTPPASMKTKTSTVIHATSSSYTVRVLGKREPIGLPPHCVAVANKTIQADNLCPSYCCSDLSTSIRGDGSGNNNRPTASPVVRQRGSTRMTSTYSPPTTTVTRLSSVVITPSSIRLIHPNSNNVLEQQQRGRGGGAIRAPESSTEENFSPVEFSANKYPDESNDAVSDHWINRPNKGVNYVKTKSGNNDKPVRQKREVNNRLHTMVEGIRLIEFNESITEEYCSNCKEGNFTYRIPISRYMPQQPLSLEFTLSNASGVFVDICQTGNKVTECSLSQMPINTDLKIGPTNERKTEELTPAWVLPIGSFVESSYMFRVTTIENHVEACKASSSLANVQFVEYNFVFYRTCAD
ncbi:hypothetical protein CHUAL_004235 [Chamberlinius hualienensis]